MEDIIKEYGSFDNMLATTDGSELAVTAL